MTAASNKTHFFLRKLHSLTGLAICGFILEHFFTNSASIHALLGNSDKAAETFNTHVHFLHSLPALQAIEIGALLMPFVFHIFYGLYIWFFTGAGNVASFQYARNFCYTAQRISGILIFVFLLVHVIELRFGGEVIPADGKEVRVETSTNDTQYTIEKQVKRYKGEEAALEADFVVETEHDYYSHVVNYFEKLPTAGLVLYVLGIITTAFHFANGLFLAGITWGLWTRSNAQKMAFNVCMIVGVGVAIVGFLSILGFKGIVLL